MAYKTFSTFATVDNFTQVGLFQKSAFHFQSRDQLTPAIYEGTPVDKSLEVSILNEEELRSLGTFVDATDRHFLHDSNRLRAFVASLIAYRLDEDSLDEFIDDLHDQLSDEEESPVSNEVLENHGLAATINIIVEELQKLDTFEDIHTALFYAFSTPAYADGTRDFESYNFYYQTLSDLGIDVAVKKTKASDGTPVNIYSVINTGKLYDLLRSQENIGYIGYLITVDNTGDEEVISTEAALVNTDKDEAQSHLQKYLPNDTKNVHTYFAVVFNQGKIFDLVNTSITDKHVLDFFEKKLDALRKETK